MPLDNLFHIQNKTAQDILNSYSSGLLPQSLLFYGPKNSGRLTGAMDLSFFLTGNEDKRDVLRSNSIIYLPSREMSGRIRTALELFKTQRTRSARLFLIESIRLSLMQYHPALSASLCPCCPCHGILHASLLYRPPLSPLPVPWLYPSHSHTAHSPVPSTSLSGSLIPCLGHNRRCGVGKYIMGYILVVGCKGDMGTADSYGISRTVPYPQP